MLARISLGLSGTVTSTTRRGALLACFPISSADATLKLTRKQFLSLGSTTMAPTKALVFTNFVPAGLPELGKHFEYQDYPLADELADGHVRFKVRSYGPVHADTGRSCR